MSPEPRDDDTPFGRHLRYWSPAALQWIGLVCIVIAAFMLYDGWRALGAFGVALIAVAEFASRRSSP